MQLTKLLCTHFDAPQRTAIEYICTNGARSLHEDCVAINRKQKQANKDRKCARTWLFVAPSRMSAERRCSASLVPLPCKTKQPLRPMSERAAGENWFGGNRSPAEPCSSAAAATAYRCLTQMTRARFLVASTFINSSFFQRTSLASSESFDTPPF
jgi:hypothetical protein